MAVLGSPGREWGLSVNIRERKGSQERQRQSKANMQYENAAAVVYKPAE